MNRRAKHWLVFWLICHFGAAPAGAFEHIVTVSEDGSAYCATFYEKMNEHGSWLELQNICSETVVVWFASYDSCKRLDDGKFRCGVDVRANETQRMVHSNLRNSGFEARSCYYRTRWDEKTCTPGY